MAILSPVQPLSSTALQLKTAGSTENKRTKVSTDNKSWTVPTVPNFRVSQRILRCSWHSLKRTSTKSTLIQTAFCLFAFEGSRILTVLHRGNYLCNLADQV